MVLVIELVLNVGSVEAAVPFCNGSSCFGIFFFFFDMLVSESRSYSAPIRTSFDDCCFSLKLPPEAFIVLFVADAFLFV